VHSPFIVFITPISKIASIFHSWSGKLIGKKENSIPSLNNGMLSKIKNTF